MLTARFQPAIQDSSIDLPEVDGMFQVAIFKIGQVRHWVVQPGLAKTTADKKHIIRGAMIGTTQSIFSHSSAKLRIDQDHRILKLIGLLQFRNERMQRQIKFRKAWGVVWKLVNMCIVSPMGNKKDLFVLPTIARITPSPSLEFGICPLEFDPSMPGPPISAKAETVLALAFSTRHPALKRIPHRPPAKSSLTHKVYNYPYQ